MMLYKKQKAFSLVEALMGILVIGLIFIMMAPFVIKKVNFDKTRKSSQGFYFEHLSNEIDNTCYQTQTVSHPQAASQAASNDALGNTDTLQLIPTNNCQKYEFTVPDNVHYLDLTLVAGGGGGGGAAGSSIYSTKDYGAMYDSKGYKRFYQNPNQSGSNPAQYKDNIGVIKFDFLKDIYVKFMTSSGDDGLGSEIDNGNYIEMGKGGYSGNAIIDYKMTRKIIYDMLFKEPIELFVKKDPGAYHTSDDYKAYKAKGEEYNPLDSDKKIKENYQRFFISDIETNKVINNEWDGDCRLNPNNPLYTTCVNNAIKRRAEKYRNAYGHTYSLIFYRYGKPTSKQDVNDKMCNMYNYNLITSDDGKEYYTSDTYNDSGTVGGNTQCSDENNACCLYKLTAYRAYDPNKEIHPTPQKFTSELWFDSNNKLSSSLINYTNGALESSKLLSAPSASKNIIERGETLEEYPNRDPQVYINKHIKGQEGKNIEQAGDHGKGGRGGELYNNISYYYSRGEKRNCSSHNNQDYCAISLQTPHKLKNGELTNNAGHEIYVTYEFPGTPGSGGVGGAAVTLNKFPVIPGSRYTIYVGNGGAGGNSGITMEDSTTEYCGYISNPLCNDLDNKGNKGTNGHDGIGGTSTALYDEEGNLVVMVLGGAGGNKGENKYTGFLLFHRVNLYESFQYERQENPVLFNRPDLGNLAQSNPLPEIKALRHYPVVILGSNYSNIIPNDQFVSTKTIEIKGTDNNNLSLGTNHIIRYTPANTVGLLNTDSRKIYTTDSSIVAADYDDRMGGFRNYSKAVAEMDEGNKYFTHPTFVTAPTNSAGVDLVYNGFYSRYVDGIDYMYPGGLGGFSGISTKAGCGGGFVGNKEGIAKEKSDSEKSKYTDFFRNTITFSSNVANNRNSYKVSSLYDNCTINSPNGQSAEFVRPKISTIDGISFGQAGAGGGGGGWSTKYGSGSGGSGQSGYVFIVWDK